MQLGPAHADLSAQGFNAEFGIRMLVFHDGKHPGHEALIGGGNELALLFGPAGARQPVLPVLHNELADEIAGWLGQQHG